MPQVNRMHYGIFSFLSVQVFLGLCQTHHLLHIHTCHTWTWVCVNNRIRSAKVKNSVSPTRKSTLEKMKVYVDSAAEANISIDELSTSPSARQFCVYNTFCVTLCNVDSICLPLPNMINQFIKLSTAIASIRTWNWLASKIVIQPCPLTSQYSRPVCWIYSCGFCCYIKLEEYHAIFSRLSYERMPIFRK